MGGKRPRDGDQPVPEDGVVLRPDMVVLGEDALVPPRNLIRPAPNRFTHELIVDEPYRFDRPEPTNEPDGVIRAGTPVAVLVVGTYDAASSTRAALIAERYGWPPSAFRGQARGDRERGVDERDERFDEPFRFVQAEQRQLG